MNTTIFPREKKVQSSDFVDLELTEGIIIMTNKDVRITLQVAKEIVSSRLALSEGLSFPVLSDARNIRIVDKDARNYFGSLEAGEGVKAFAILVGPFFSTFMANFFVRFTLLRPRVPVRLFTDMSEALKWLGEFKE